MIHISATSVDIYVHQEIVQFMRSYVYSYIFLKPQELTSTTHPKLQKYLYLTLCLHAILYKLVCTGWEPLEQLSIHHSYISSIWYRLTFPSMLSVPALTKYLLNLNLYWPILIK